MKYLLRILRTTRELWPYYLGIVVCSVLTAATALVAPFIVKTATDTIVAQVSGGQRVALSTILVLATMLLVADLANTLVSNVGGYLGDVMAVRMRRRLSVDYYRKLLALPQRYFDNELTGTIINRLNRSITEVTQFVNTASNNFFPMILTVLAVLGISAWYSWPLAVLLLVIFPTFAWLTTLTSKRWQVLEGQKNEQLDLAGGRFAEVVGQMRVVKSFVRERDELAGFARRYDSTVATTRVQSRFWHLMDVSRRGALNLIFFGIYLIIFFQTARGDYSIGVMVLLIQLVAMARQPVTIMSYLVDTGQHAIAGSMSYFAVMDEEEDRAVEGSLRSARGAAPSLAEPVEGAPMVEFDHVSFGYDEDPDVLHDVTFSVATGERLALVGESGGGKTTLVNLLLGLYVPRSGTIRVQGVDIAEMGLAELRQRVGVVFQDASLFSGSIRENLTYGRPDASDEQMRAAARSANAETFIQRFADGYDAIIGERGLKLSGGQKQRIAVARAMVKDAPVLVLDEATSALDSKSERLVQMGLDNLMHGRTSLIIAHRLATIASVDRIVTLKAGTVDEIGSPAELAQTDGIYAELLALQGSGSRRDKKKLQAFDLIG